MPGDRRTAAYFDTHEHHYPPSRLRSGASWIAARQPRGGSLIDVGCGRGDVLEALARATGCTDLCALDISAESLAAARERTGCRTVLASVLDEEALRPLRGRFDVVVAAALLHHLVGPTRRASRRNARRGFANALSLARPGGHLLLMEPVWQPRAAMWAVFWVKRLTTTVTQRRLPLFGYWNNLGAPLVSFYGHDELLDLAARLPGAEVVEVERRDRDLGRLGWLLSRADTTLLLRRPG